MDILLTGSIAFDYLMTFPGHFRDHILPDQLDRISLSFLVDTMIRRRGGIAANIAYTLGLLGERPAVMATVGEDFSEYRIWLEKHGVDTTHVCTIEGENTASFFVTTDLGNAQIASFYTGAMARATSLHLGDLPEKPGRVVVSANDPGAMNAYVAECHAQGLPYIYDPSQQVVRLDADALRQGIEGAEAVFGNDYEFRLIEEKTGLDPVAITSFARFVVVTRGEQGVDILEASDRISLKAVAPRNIVDPTGVGDAFRGGFIKGMLQGLPLATCGRMGSLAATWCLENAGPQGHDFDVSRFADRYHKTYGETLLLGSGAAA